LKPLWQEMMCCYFRRCSNSNRKVCFLAYSTNLFSEERLASSVKKILKFKFKAGLNSYKPILTANVYNDLNALENDALQYELFENALTVLKNEDAVPIKI
jgi:beta-glucosidase-like glycosyl hydrolase